MNEVAVPGRAAHEGAGIAEEAGAVVAFCGQCGEPLGDPVHARCGPRAELEPPRYCARCRRRMVVQVTPRGWSATCSRHGTVTG